MNPFTADGIVLRTYPYGEADLVVRLVMAGHGKVSALARSARKSKKRFASSIDLLDRGRFEIKAGSGSLPLVQSFIPGRSFRAIRDNLDKLTAAAVVCEALDHLTLEQANTTEDIFELLALSLEALEQAGSRKDILRSCFHAVSGILKTTGYFDDRFVRTPSMFHLLALLEQVERASDKKLESKEALLDVLASYRREAARSGEETPSELGGE